VVVEVDEDRLRRIVEALRDDPFARSLGIELLEARPGYSRLRKCVGLTAEICYLSTVDSGATLIAEATEEHLGQRTALYHVNVSTEDGDLVASCQGVAYRKKEAFPG
jgi:acyl-coenzyme A thioesterase PaaI-like protein